MVTNDTALFPISIVSEMMNVHPETVRVWERAGLISPQRRSGKRFYSQNDVLRLRFIKKLMSDQLNIPAIRHYLKLYPCWNMDTCPSCMSVSRDAACSKPCWKEEGSYCQVDGNKDLCSNCEYRNNGAC